jgi:hypothetical protein
MMMAWKVRGLSHRPAIIASRPASMRLAIAISPSRDRSSTEPISRRYMRTGSSVRSAGSVRVVVVAGTAWVVSARPSSSSGCSSAASWPSSPSSVSMTLMPMSDSMAIVSSICSDDTSSDGSTEFSSS